MREESAAEVARSAGCDADVWRRVLAGDASSFGLIWDRHAARVHRHLLTCDVPSADVEDLTAVTFLEAWRRRSAVRFVDDSLLPWLLVTAHNVSRNHARARRRHARFLATLPPPEPAPDHAERYPDREDGRAAALRAALRRARPTDARLLALTAVDGLTVREAATALGLTEPAAKMRLSRLRRRLRSEIAPHPDVPLLEGGP